jgi:hypothetical protein
MGGHWWAWVAADGYGLGMGTNSKENVEMNRLKFKALGKLPIGLEGSREFMYHVYSSLGRFSMLAICPPHSR